MVKTSATIRSRSAKECTIAVPQLGLTRDLMGYKGIVPPSITTSAKDKPWSKYYNENEELCRIAVQYNATEKQFDSMHRTQPAWIVLPSSFVRVPFVKTSETDKVSAAFNKIKTVPYGTNGVYEYDISTPAGVDSDTLSENYLIRTPKSALPHNDSSQVGNEEIVHRSEPYYACPEESLDKTKTPQSILKVGVTSSPSKSGKSRRRIRFDTAIVFEFEVEASEESDDFTVCQGNSEDSSKLSGVSKEEPRQVAQSSHDATSSKSKNEISVKVHEPLPVSVSSNVENSRDVEQRTSGKDYESRQVSPNFIVDADQPGDTASALAQPLPDSQVKNSTLVRMTVSKVRMVPTCQGRRQRLRKFFTECFESCAGNGTVAR